jgi:hypothetical protein
LDILKNSGLIGFEEITDYSIINGKVNIFLAQI